TTTIGPAAGASDMRHRRPLQLGDDVRYGDVRGPFDGADDRRLGAKAADNDTRRRGHELDDPAPQRLEQAVLGEREPAAKHDDGRVEDDDGVRDPDRELVDDGLDRGERVVVSRASTRDDVL